MDVYVHTEVIERMNPDEKYQLLREAEFLADNCEARITISQTSGFKHIFNVLTGRDLAYRRQIELDSNQLNKIILSMLRILYDDVLNIQNEQLSIEERVVNLERNVALVMSIQRKMLDKLSNNDETWMKHLSGKLVLALENEKERQQEVIDHSPSNIDNATSFKPLDRELSKQERAEIAAAAIAAEIANRPPKDINVSDWGVVKHSLFPKWKQISTNMYNHSTFCLAFPSKYQNKNNDEIINIIKQNNDYIIHNGWIYFIDKPEITERNRLFLCKIKEDGTSERLLVHFGNFYSTKNDLFIEDNKLYFGIMAILGGRLYIEI